MISLSVCAGTPSAVKIYQLYAFPCSTFYGMTNFVSPVYTAYTRFEKQRELFASPLAQPISSI